MFITALINLGNRYRENLILTFTEHDLELLRTGEELKDNIEHINLSVKLGNPMIYGTGKPIVD